MIAFRDIAVSYPSRATPVLDGVSIDVPRGQITSVVGPNGSGKSTLVRALLQGVAITKGSILIDGAPLNTLSRRHVATRVAVMAQREEVTFPLRVTDYVNLGLFPRIGIWGNASASDRKTQQYAIEVAEIGDLLDRTISEISGGEWQRVRIARALAQGGDAVVLDEPTTFLDIGHEMAIFELLEVLRQANKAILLISHHLNLVARFASSMHLLSRGRLVASGPPSVVMDPGLLRRVYEWPMRIDDVGGAPALTPMRRSESIER